MQQKFPRKVLVPKTTADFTSRVSKSYVPFTCKFPIVKHFVPILHRRCRSKTNFYVFSYDKTSLNISASFRFVLAVFMQKFQKKNLLSELCEKRNSKECIKIEYGRRKGGMSGSPSSKGRFWDNVIQNPIHLQRFPILQFEVVSIYNVIALEFLKNRGHKQSCATQKKKLGVARTPLPLQALAFNRFRHV